MSGHTTELSDQHSIDTPELVAIQFPLAGIGSRFLAVAVDYLIQSVVIVAIVLFFFLLPGTAGLGRVAAVSPKWAVAILILSVFLLQWGYFTLFEAFRNGQTPGKRLVHLRVIQQTGRPIGLFESLTRNLLRVIDSLPSGYFVGALCILLTRRQQRLGDLAAGTLVVRETETESRIAGAGAARMVTAGVFEPKAETPSARSRQIPADALARLSPSDLQLIDSFLERRLDLPFEIASNLSQKLAATLSQKMGFAIPAAMSSDSFLEQAAAGVRELSS